MTQKIHHIIKIFCHHQKVFFIKKNSDDDKKSYLFDRFFVSNQNFTTENVKVIKNSRFFDQISRFFQVFFKISQIPGFSRLFQPKLSSSRFFSGISRFQGKVATLIQLAKLEIKH